MSYRTALENAQQVLASLQTHESTVEQIAATMLTAVRDGRKILLCGNGGSACEAQHLAAELAGHYQRERRALPAVALSADGALLTCIGNDFDFNDIFARQVEALGNPGDVLMMFTTSGNSPNVLQALDAARQRGLVTITLLGRGGGAARGKAILEIIVAHDDTARIQEAHQFLLHALMDIIERDDLR